MIQLNSFCLIHVLSFYIAFQICAKIAVYYNWISCDAVELFGFLFHSICYWCFLCCVIVPLLIFC